jgi:hypothetical protein
MNQPHGVKYCKQGNLINLLEDVSEFASCITRTYKSLMQSDAKRILETDKFFIMCKIIVVVSIPRKN